MLMLSGEICGGLNSIPLRWITGMYHWMENIQKYDQPGFNYLDELTLYVNNNLGDNNFVEKTSNIHVLGCHENSCSGKSINDMDARVRNFEKILSSFGLQFGAHATAEPPFKAFPGQIPPTQPPTILVETNFDTASPTGRPTSSAETVTTQVNVYLTGVKPDVNMTEPELLVFEKLMFDLLDVRLETVGVTMDEVIVDSQYPGVDYTFDSNFNSQSGEGDIKPVLQVLMNMTLTFNPPPPDGWRDWSIYIKSWIESFGVTMVEIFTSPKHIQHPDTDSKFWDSLVDVSATNVPPPRNITTEIPTPPPTFIIYPEPDPNDKFIVIGAAGAGSLFFLFFVAFIAWKIYKRKQLYAALERKRLDDLEKEEGPYVPGAPLISLFDNPKNLESDSESSSDSSSSSSESSSDDDSESESESDAESSSEEEESVFTNEKSEANESNFSRSVSTGVHTNATDESEEANLAAIGEENSSSEEESEESEEESYEEEMSEQSRTAVPIPSKEKEVDEFDLIVERVIANDPALTALFLDDKCIGRREDVGEPLYNALANNQHVVELSLRNNEIDDEAVSSLSLALVENKSITHVYLGDNFITAEGVECEYHLFISTLLFTSWRPNILTCLLCHHLLLLFQI